MGPCRHWRPRTARGGKPIPLGEGTIGSRRATKRISELRNDDADGKYERELKLKLKLTMDK
jgi:hypothetical protein